MRQVYESQQTEAIILVVASNAFNSLNREAALRNIQRFCLFLSKVIINNYRENSQLFIEGSTIYSIGVPTRTSFHCSLKNYTFLEDLNFLVMIIIVTHISVI